LAVTENNGTGDGSLAIFLGDGKGGFRLSASYQIGVASGFVTVADFNGDGHLDAAVTDQGFEGRGGDVIVFFGNGHGQLTRDATFKMSQQPVGIAAGDLNGDRHPDLAVTLARDGTVAVFLNDGTGKFLKPVTYNAGGGEAVGVKIADLRHDGRNDLLVANLSKNELAVLLNKGDGTFNPAQFYITGFSWGSGTEAVVIADFRLNGNLDVAAVNEIDNSVLLYGNGDGTFEPAVEIHDKIRSDGGYSIAAGNFITGNKAPDLAIPIQDDGKVAIMINTQ
jgi:hypothetical protein